DLNREAHGDRVERPGEGLNKRDPAGKTSAIVARAPVAETDRRVDDNRIWGESVGERGRIDVRLERRAGLAQRVGRAVELARSVVPTADDRTHAAVEIGEHRGRLVRVVLAAVILE